MAQAKDNLTREDKAIRLDPVMLVDTKTIDMDRALINLFMLLKHRGLYPASRTGQVDRTAEGLRDWLCVDPNFPGFAQHPDVVLEWLKSDLLDLVNRGDPDRQALAAPRPVHLNAYKLRNARHCKDYRASAQLYRLLSDEDERLVTDLRRFLLEGCDPATDKYQGGPADIETLAVLRLADREGKDAPGKEPPVPPYRPLCIGQGRLLRNDVARLLRYEKAIPRPVWVEYFKTLCGFHLALFVRRMAAQVGAWMRLRAITPECPACPVSPMAGEPLAGCPFPVEFIVDMGDRADTPMAALSRASAEGHFAALDQFVRDLMGLTKLIQYVESTGYKQKSSLDLIGRALALYAEDSLDLRGWSRAHLGRIIGTPPDPRLARVRDEFADDPFRAYVEAILLLRFGWHRGYFRQLFRSLLGSNRDTGMLVSGRSPRSPVRFHLGTRLLETLVQIAVLRPDGVDAAGQSRFRSEPILIGELLWWLRRRYGITIGAAQVGSQAALSPGELRALRENEEQFKNRLREIGFFSDLSDAANAQRVRPRYRVEA